MTIQNYLFEPWWLSTHEWIGRLMNSQGIDLIKAVPTPMVAYSIMPVQINIGSAPKDSELAKYLESVTNHIVMIHNLQFGDKTPPYEHDPYLVGIAGI